MNSQQPILIGMDFGGTKKLDGIIAASSRQPLVQTRRYLTKTMTANTELLAETRRSLQEFGATPGNCVIGVSAAGTIDRDRLRILRSPNTRLPLPIDFAEHLHRTDGYRVVLGNDLAMAAYGIGQLTGHGNAVVMTFSSGMNTGVMVNGQLLETETGHAEYPYAADWPWQTPPTCNCPGHPHKRCTESFVSGNAAGKMFRAAYLDGQVGPDHPVFGCLLQKLNAAQADGAPFSAADLLDPARRDKILDQLASEHVYAGHVQAPDAVTERIRSIQERAIAFTIRDAVLHYGRQPITLIGGMTHWWDLLFVPAIKRAATEGSSMLAIPAVEKCPYAEPCLVGAALYARDQFA